MNIRDNRKKYLKEYRAKQSELKKIDKNQKSLNTLTDAIRAIKARAEANKLRDEKNVKNDVSSISNSIIDAVPVKSKNKKNSQAVAIQNAKKAHGEAKIYNT